MTSSRLVDHPIVSVDDLVQYHALGARPRSEFRVGTEHEKIGVYADGTPIHYEGPHGIAAVLDRLAAKSGWTRVFEEGRIIALERGVQRVTLEPGGQIELSGAPLGGGREIVEELEAHLGELKAITDPLGIALLAIGFRPFGTLDQVSWVPKGRYAVMREVLPRRGRLALDMMKRTATVQANLDYADEYDAARKLRAAMSVTSVVTAMFANSPIVEGQDSGWQSYRAEVWLATDPDRCGLLPFVFEPGPIFRRYVEWGLDVPMFFVYRHGRYLPAFGMTFRRFLRDGFQGERASLADWELHVSTLFPEARLKQYLELRGADAGSVAMTIALPVLWLGLLHDDSTCAAAEGLTAGLGMAEREALRRAVPRAGLLAPVGRGRIVRDLAHDLLAIAQTALRGSAQELAALEPLEEIVSSGRTPADRVRDVFRQVGGDPAQVCAALRY